MYPLFLSLYSLVYCFFCEFLLPDVKLSRTTIRSKIDENPQLRRVLNITSEMCQMDQMWHGIDELMCTPKELYDDLIKLGALSQHYGKALEQESIWL